MRVGCLVNNQFDLYYKSWNPTIIWPSIWSFQAHLKQQQHLDNQWSFSSSPNKCFLISIITYNTYMLEVTS
jgi:hypothetical protein